MRFFKAEIALPESKIQDFFRSRWQTGIFWSGAVVVLGMLHAYKTISIYTRAGSGCVQIVGTRCADFRFFCAGGAPRCGAGGGQRHITLRGTRVFRFDQWLQRALDSVVGRVVGIVLPENKFVSFFTNGAM